MTFLVRKKVAHLVLAQGKCLAVRMEIYRWNPGGTLKASRLTGSLGIRSMNNGSGGSSRTVTPYMLSVEELNHR